LEQREQELKHKLAHELDHREREMITGYPTQQHSTEHLDSSRSEEYRRAIENLRHHLGV